MLARIDRGKTQKTVLGQRRVATRHRIDQPEPLRLRHGLGVHRLGLFSENGMSLNIVHPFATRAR
ncbi:hypothetical protein OA90_00340 [Labrenzia sp. OB1]|nr:hypothetical protein OA90_00340 [Labrenzia sp. OB1]